MSEEKKEFNVEAFKAMAGGTFARPTLFELEIEGFEKARFLIHKVTLDDDLIETFSVYENEDGNTTQMLLALKEKCNEAGTRWKLQRRKDDPDGAVEVYPTKPGFKATLTRFRRDGTGYVTQLYIIDEITFHTSLDWDDTNKVLCHEVYVGHCEKIPDPD